MWVVHRRIMVGGFSSLWVCSCPVGILRGDDSLFGPKEEILSRDALTLLNKIIKSGQ